MARTIQSPGVEIKEFDRSQRASIPTGTNILVTGFAAKGPTDEVIQVTSLGEFESIYGIPTTPAERYFYGTVKPLFNSPANIIAYRLPYGTDAGVGFGNNYSALVYPITGVNNMTGNKISSYQSTSATYILGAPVHQQLTLTQYNNILQSNGFEWDNDFGDKTAVSTFAGIGKAGMIILNKGRTTIDQRFEGFYIGALDNTNLNPATNFDGILDAYTITGSADSTINFTPLPASRLDFSLSSISDNSTITFGQDNDSISEIMENLSQYDISTRSFDDTLSIGLFKFRQSPFTPDVIKLTGVLSESYVGSFDYHRQQNSQQGGTPISFFMETTEGESPNITILINDNLSNKNGNTYLNADGLPTNKIRMAKTGLTSISTISGEYAGPGAADSIYTTLNANIIAANDSIGKADSLFPLGVYSNSNLTTKIIGSVPKKIDRLLDSIENVEIFDIDITVDGGLSTIFANTQMLSVSSFDDTSSIPAISGLRVSNITIIGEDARNYISYWKEITDRFQQFAEIRRKDHIYISDLPRNLFVEGEDFLTLQDPEKNFSRDVLNPIKAFTSKINSNYVAMYAQWVKTFDTYLDNLVYTPFSGFAAQAMANTDSNFQPWFAPAGFTRGRVAGASDLALFPTQKQRDQLYKIGANPVAFFPGEGFTILVRRRCKNYLVLLIELM
jgi:hypothetical protein